MKDSENDKFIKPFGYQLCVDCYNCKPGVCDDAKLAYDFLVDIVDKLGMTIFVTPLVFFGPDSFPEKAGLSSFVGLIESNVTTHTLSKKNFISIDIYSCHEFSPEGIGEFCKEYFGAKEVETNFILRGTKYYD